MFTLPDLPYAYNALEPYIDEQTMHLHHDKHHAAYVNNLNKALDKQENLLNMRLEDLLKSLDQVPQTIRTKVENNAGQHFNHSFFWTILGPTKNEPPKELLQVIENNFTSFAKFKDNFTSTSLNHFGSGWAWVTYDGKKLAIISTVNQKTPLMEGKKPLLVLDLWEHAYYLKYQNRRIDYITAWWNIINWNKVLECFRQASL